MAVVEYQKEGKIAIMTFNRPDARNALSAEVHQLLHDAMLDFRDDPNVWVAILTGVGDKAFCAGQDIKEFKPGPRTEAVSAYNLADTIWKPFIAAINGVAVGGGLELALSCDIRIAADTARFGQPEINIGYMTGGGASQRLPRFIPRAKAAEILLMGDMVDAQEAYRVGLINKVVPAADLMKTAREWANHICERGPLGVRKTKEAMIRGYSLPLLEGLKLEQKFNNELRNSEDFMEGARAFAEKRPPVYKGK
jgi:enoyl-CoA hydratase/carnithine racemase